MGAEHGSDHVTGLTDIDFLALFNVEPTPSAVLSPDLVILLVNDAYLAATTRERTGLIGKHVSQAFPAEVVRHWETTNIPVKDAAGSVSMILQRLAPTAVGDTGDADDYGVRHELQALQDTNLALRGERDRLAARALRDPLTGALSRSVFYEELARALSRMSRRPHPLAVLFIDLDRLKQVNDSHGHAAGDELIRQTGARLASSVRPSDAIARIGGDEFVVLLDDLQTPEEAEVIAARVLRSLSQPCPVAPSVWINPSASVGVALADPELPGPDVLLSHADAAMYKAKQAGRGRYELFDAAAYMETTARIQLEAELRAAISEDQLTLHYQPIFNLSTGTLGAVEALLRWRHPRRGILGAQAFIDVAEDSGLLRSIGPWVIGQSCRQLAKWDTQLGQRAPRQIYINLSVGELVQPGLHEGIAAATAAAAIAPDRLVIEITESGMLDKPGSVTEAVDRLVGLGCGVAIDDFGTGYSALSRLVDLPADILKIDQSFVHGLSRGHESAAVIAAVLLLAHNLRKTVVAEGVEDPAALATLTELGCEHAQGYYLGRPQPAEVITKQLRRPTLVTG